MITKDRRIIQLGVLMTLSFIITLLWINTQPTRARSRLNFFPWLAISAPGFTDANSSGFWNADTTCDVFPDTLLDHIQPVLKTGHRAIDRARNSLLSTSNCLSNLLVISDLAEDLAGVPIIDVIADIPVRLLENSSQLDPYRRLQGHQAIDLSLDDLMTAEEGWKTDKFKFLAGISRAWRVAPGKDWFVFYEDDTYVFWDTVFHLLKNLDPEQPLYFGSPSPGRDKTWFANGGPGFVLSRGAMQRLVDGDWNHTSGEWLKSRLTEAYWNDILEDCCGDSVLGYVLYKLGMPLKGLWPLFNPHSLRDIPFSDSHWCQPVLSLHKTSQDDVFDLWRWQHAFRTVKSRPLIYRDLAMSFFDVGSQPIKEDWNNGAWQELASETDAILAHTSHLECELACKNSKSCIQWMYHQRQCTFGSALQVGHAEKPHLSSSGQGAIADAHSFTAGWDVDKIKAWMQKRKCEKIRWEEPSTSRIY